MARFLNALLRLGLCRFGAHVGPCSASTPQDCPLQRLRARWALLRSAWAVGARAEWTDRHVVEARVGEAPPPEDAGAQAEQPRVVERFVVRTASVVGASELVRESVYRVVP